MKRIFSWLDMQNNTAVIEIHVDGYGKDDLGGMKVSLGGKQHINYNAYLVI